MLTDYQKVTEQPPSTARWLTKGIQVARWEALMWPAPEFMRRIGTVLRVKDDDFAQEPLPERWVDLIHYLDEKERREEREQLTFRY